ncbi:MAG TPA: hypothetical protein VGH11_01625 [Jatrophihabitans sp.]|jgi:hypothetical protein
MSNRVAIVTCEAFIPDGLDEDRLLLQACARAGVGAELVSWSDRTVDWDGYDLAVLRSTWDYTGRRAEFLNWVAAVPRLCNPVSVVSANTDKRYLADLARIGVPVVPTSFAAPGEWASLPATGDFIVKPAVGAGSRGAGRFDAGLDGELDRATAHVGDLHAKGVTAMVQPYLDGVDTYGETALIFIEGRFSHAIRKGRMLAEGVQYAFDGPALFIPEQISARTPDAAEIALGTRVVGHFAELAGEPLLYARIDLLPSPDGPVVVEAELTEPSLFLDHDAESADRLAAAIADRIL